MSPVESIVLLARAAAHRAITTGFLRSTASRELLARVHNCRDRIEIVKVVLGVTRSIARSARMRHTNLL